MANSTGYSMDYMFSECVKRQSWLANLVIAGYLFMNYSPGKVTSEPFALKKLEEALA